MGSRRSVRRGAVVDIAILLPLPVLRHRNEDNYPGRRYARAGDEETATDGGYDYNGNDDHKKEGEMISNKAIRAANFIIQDISPYGVTNKKVPMVFNYKTLAHVIKTMNMVSRLKRRVR